MKSHPPPTPIHPSFLPATPVPPAGLPVGWLSSETCQLQSPVRFLLHASSFLLLFLLLFLLHSYGHFKEISNGNKGRKHALNSVSPQVPFRLQSQGQMRIRHRLAGGGWGGGSRRGLCRFLPSVTRQTPVGLSESEEAKTSPVRALVTLVTLAVDIPSLPQSVTHSLPWCWSQIPLASVRAAPSRRLTRVCETTWRPNNGLVLYFTFENWFVQK